MSVVIECGCGNIFEAKRRSKYGRCPNCALRAKQIRQARWRDKQKEFAASLEKALENGVVSLIVVHDPLPIGGFAAGALFHKEDIEQMIRLGTFTPGTTLRDGQGRLYEYRIQDWRTL